MNKIINKPMLTLKISFTLFVICLLQGCVGATIVASIETIWAGTVTPPAGSDVFSWKYPTTGDNAITLKKGEEMGRFKLGSTVVLAWGADKAEILEDQLPEVVTRLGTAFAKIND